MIVFRRDEDIAIKRTRPWRPMLWCEVTVLPIMGGTGLVEERQLSLLMSTSSNSASVRFWEFRKPIWHGFAVATGSCASDDDGDSRCFHSFQVVYVNSCLIVDDADLQFSDFTRRNLHRPAGSHQ